MDPGKVNGNTVMVFGRSRTQIQPGDVKIVYALRLERTDQLALLVRYMRKHSRRKPITQEEVEKLLVRMGGAEMYCGAEEVQAAVVRLEGLREAMGRLNVLLAKRAGKERRKELPRRDDLYQGDGPPFHRLRSRNR